MKRALAVILSSLLVAMPAFADRTVYAPVRLAPVATAGTILFDDGTAAAPSMSFSADPDNGMYRGSSNVLSFAAGGAGQLHLQSNTVWFGRALISSGAMPTNFDVLPGYSSSTNTAGTNLKISGGPGTGTAAGGALIFQTSPAGGVSGTTANNGTERMRIASDGTIVFGNGLSAASPTSTEIRATAGSGTDIAGANLTISGGRSTGSAAGGAVIFRTTGSGASGSAENSITERMRITSGGDILAGTTTAQTGSRYVFDGATNNFRIQGDSEARLLLEDKGVADASKPFQYLQSDGGSLILGNADRSGTGTSGSTARMTITSTGQIQVGDGTAAAPVLSFSADTDTGVYRVSGDVLGFATGGTQGMTIGNGRVRAGGGTAALPAWAFLTDTDTGMYSPGADQVSIATGGTERTRVKAAGQLRFIPLAADPAGAEAGDVYYNSGTNKLKVYNGTAWVDLH